MGIALFLGEVRGDEIVNYLGGLASIVSLLLTVLVARSGRNSAQPNELGTRLAVIALIAIVGGGTAGYILQGWFEDIAGRELQPDLTFVVPLGLLAMGFAMAIRYHSWS